MPQDYLTELTDFEPKLATVEDATRIALIKMLPVQIVDEASGKNLSDFLGVINSVVEQIRKYIARMPRLYDIDDVPDRWILDLSTLIGNDFDYFAPTDGSKRKKVKALYDLYKHKGTSYTFRFIWQQYGIHKIVHTINMSENLMVLSQQGGLSVMEDKNADWISKLLLHDFGDNDLCKEWIGKNAADRTVDEYTVDTSFIKEGVTSGRGVISGISWERMPVENVTGYTQFLETAPTDLQADSTEGWNYFGGAFDNNYIYFAPTDSTVFVRYNANHQGDDTWRIHDSTAWDIIEQKEVVGFSQQSAFYGACFDGQYIYFAPYAANTFLRYDTEAGAFTDSSSWEGFGIDHLFTTLPRFAFTYCDYDGRYVYFSPNWSQTFVRFDTQGNFYDSAMWEQCDIMKATRGLSGDSTQFSFYGAVSLDDWVYFIPMSSRKFLRFYKNGTFNDSSSWQQITKDAVYEYDTDEVTTTYVGGAEDGRFVYFVPRQAEKFLRFDTAQNNFNDPSDWHKLDVEIGMDGTHTEDMFNGAIYDGQYIYFVPDQANTIVRYNTLSYYFQTQSSWDSISLSSAMGKVVGNATFAGGSYDGRYVYLSPLLSQRFIRYDTFSQFNKFVNDWQPIAIWENTDWPRRHSLIGYNDFYIYINIPDVDMLASGSNFLFELRNSAGHTGRLLWEKRISLDGWTRIKLRIGSEHDSTSGYNLNNLGYSKITLRLNPDDHRGSYVWFDELMIVDSESYKGFHGGYLQDGMIHHEGSILIDTHEWITDNQTLKELIDDIWPLGFHPWLKFHRWFPQEIFPDSTANWSGLGASRFKIFHRRLDMNITWLPLSDTIYTLGEHKHITDEWTLPGGPSYRHIEIGPYITTRTT